MPEGTYYATTMREAQACLRAAKRNLGEASRLFTLMGFDTASLRYRTMASHIQDFPEQQGDVGVADATPQQGGESGS